MLTLLVSDVRRAQDNYEIIKKIGRGKYSEVYEGINTLTNQRIVIKILKPGKSQDFRILLDKQTLHKTHIYNLSCSLVCYSQEEQDQT